MGFVLWRGEPGASGSGDDYAHEERQSVELPHPYGLFFLSQGCECTFAPWQCLPYA
jgi:hypothetical protein